MIDTMEALLDPNNGDNVILLNGDGEEVEFSQLATIPANKNLYFLLHPVMDPNESAAAIFCYRIDEEKNEYLDLVSDEETWNLVISEYEKLIAKMNQEQMN